MKRAFKNLWLVLMLSTLTYSFSSAQNNLVYNGDFEIYDTCPNNVTSPGNPQIEHCQGWSAPTYATSDYFNTCASLYVGIPNNFFGSQSPQNGNAYAGFYGFTYDNAAANVHWWEYLQDSLTDNLITDHLYYVTFYISWAENQSGICTKNIGAYLSNTRPLSPNYYGSWNLPAQVKDTVCRQDSINWMLIEGQFLAQGGERYITIGHFADSTSMDTSFVKLSDSLYFPSVYYYLDNVKIIDVTEDSLISSIEVPNIFSPNADDINDSFKIKCKNISEITFVIYNRWGIKIFETDKMNAAWDGRTTSGELCNDGVYFYALKAKGKDKKTHSLKGFIQLIK